MAREIDRVLFMSLEHLKGSRYVVLNDQNYVETIWADSPEEAKAKFQYIIRER